MWIYGGSKRVKNEEGLCGGSCYDPDHILYDFNSLKVVRFDFGLDAKMFFLVNVPRLPEKSA